MSVAHWSSPAFTDSVTAWVTVQCERLGLRLTGEWEQPHCRPWSSAIRFETTGGRLWFKVNGPGTRQEAALVAVLYRLVPALVPEPVAVDPARGWSLSVDAGPALRSLGAPGTLWPAWQHIIAEYAEAQLELAGHVDVLLAAGVPTVSPVTQPRQATALLEELSGLDPDEGGLTDREIDRISARLPAFDAWCAELAASGIPDSIQHDDLHSSNICCSPDGARIIDWGDASVGFPLGTMLCTLNSIAHHAHLEPDDPQVLGVRDAYLAAFSGYASHADLVRYVDLARRAGCVTRALSYRAALLGAPADVHAELDHPVRGWFLDLLPDLAEPHP